MLEQELLQRLEDRFLITELERCDCHARARRWHIFDLQEREESTAHHGSLNPHDLSHKLIRHRLQQERELLKAA